MIKLHYSRLLSIPLLSELLYGIQLFFIFIGVDHLYISNNNHSEVRKYFIKRINNKQKELVVKDHRISLSLQDFSNEKILHLTTVKLPLASQSLAYLHDLMWTYLNCDRISEKTLDNISELIYYVTPSQQDKLKYHPSSMEQMPL